jgi:ATP-dependent Lhr-like helicase
MLALESVSVSWNEIVFALRRMEYAGTIRRGYFVRSLSGEQYALPEAVERLRAMRALNPSAEAPIALSAADPANPYGVLIPGCEITRDPANVVVIRAGRVILGLAGRALVTPAQLDDGAAQLDDGEFGAALDALMALRSRLVIDTIDGCPALESGRVHVMAARGFHSDGRALVYDGLPGPRPSRVAAADAERAPPQPRSET